MGTEYYGQTLWDSEKPSILERFDKFHTENPQVYRSLVQLARDMRSNRADRKIGMKMLFEVLRWNHFLNTNSDDDFKLCNDFTAPYARLIMAREVDLAGAFNLRPSEVDQQVLV
jgi:hypothetical protein